MLNSVTSKIQREERIRDSTEKEVDPDEYAYHPKLGPLDPLSSPVTKKSGTQNKGDETGPGMPAAIRNIGSQRRNDIEDTGNNEVHRHDQRSDLCCGLSVCH